MIPTALLKKAKLSVKDLRTILSSLNYMAQMWEQGRDTPYMNGPMNAALVKLGLELPAAPKEEKA